MLSGSKQAAGHRPRVGRGVAIHSESTRPIGLLAAAVAALALAILLPSQALGVGDVHVEQRALDDLDLRDAQIAPSGAQLAAAEALGGRVTWNEFGTPASLIDDGGFLATGLGGDEVAAARSFVEDNRALFGLSAGSAAQLELVSDSALAAGSGHVVILRQSVGELPVTLDGLISVGVVDGKVAYLSSSAFGEAGLSGSETLGAEEAWAAAAEQAGLEAGSVSESGQSGGWTELEASGLSGPQRSRAVALPLPGADAVRAFEAIVVDAEHGHGYRSFVDAASGEVIVREAISAQAADNPRWKLFPATPPLDEGDADTRAIGCFESTAGCELLFGPSSERTSATQPWDYNYTLGQPTNTTTGNNADTALSAFSPLTPGPDRAFRPTSPTREYISPWTNSWNNADCNPAVFASAPPATGPDVFGGTDANDVNAAIINLFVGHNRMHDWSYHLGFTEQNFNMQVSNFGRGGAEGDPELGDAQAGVLTGGAPTYTGRDNANQITPPDGIAPITNMYLWQPVAGAFYPPCVDGDFDMSVIGHEYTHAISNRMVAGPDSGLSSDSDGQARAMGESFSDLTAVELLQEYGYTPQGRANPFAVGPYVTGNDRVGIRNYGMNRSPLNYGNVQGYDGSGGGSPHDDGEIWSAVNFDIRAALIRRYNSRFPAGNDTLQRRCADGFVPAGRCPGNRRWMQLVFDGYLMMQSRSSMLDARDALLAADRMRFDGRNQKLLWNAFARRGFGVGARSQGTDDRQPQPDFSSPRQSNESRVRFQPVSSDGRRLPNATLMVGEYQGNVTPIADTRRNDQLDPSARFVPGRYSFVARSPGEGMFKFATRLRAGERRVLKVRMAQNWAAKRRGAKARGDGRKRGKLINESERTNWVANDPDGDVRGLEITVDLAGRRAHQVRRVQVSALLRPRRTLPSGDPDPRDPSQSRFAALRQFRIEACNASRGGSNCRGQKGFKPILTSREDAFPGGVPRPLSPNLTLRTFKVKRRAATHVRLVALTNQCTGAPQYQGEQDADPANSTDCSEDSAQAAELRANELQVFSKRSRLLR